MLCLCSSRVAHQTGAYSGFYIKHEVTRSISAAAGWDARYTWMEKVP